jgi:ATP-dependent helicase Lhr and Lhr-like helicase
VWNGHVTNDTLHPLRAFLRPPDTRVRRPDRTREFRSRRLVPPTAEGRWSAIDPSRSEKSKRISATAWSTATAQQLLARHGIVTRETANAEAIPGGFSAIYEVLKALEHSGRIRRGYFIAGLGAAQFAMPGAVDLLRRMPDPAERPRATVLSVIDPANPYGAVVKWPEPGPTRTPGARVILVDGFAAAYLRRGERELLLFVTDEEPRHTQQTRDVARTLRQLAENRGGMLLTEINGQPAIEHAVSQLFVEEGFARTALGLQVRPSPGTLLAAIGRGGTSMAEPRKDADVNTPPADESRESEQQRIRSSNDRDQAAEREGRPTPRNRGYDEAVRGEGVADVDPDSAQSDIDRDEGATE